MKKHKIIDTFFFYDELDMLVFRLTELYDHVDQFIIMESEIDFNGKSKELIFQKNQSMFDPWKDKIIYLPTHNLSLEGLDKWFNTMEKSNIIIDNIKDETKYQVQLSQMLSLYDYLMTSNYYVEDLIMISDVDEIPDLTKFPEILDKLRFSPVILRQKNFLWSTKFINLDPNFGTVCLQYSNLIIKPSDFYLFYFSRSRVNNSSLEIVDSGYHFSHFYDIESTKRKIQMLNPSITESFIENCWNNLIAINIKGDDKITRLTEYYGELPENSKLLPNQDIGKRPAKKHVIVLNSNEETQVKNFDKIGETVSFINFVTDPKLPFKSVISEEKNVYNILSPNTKYYDVLIEDNTIENFQKMYGINELKPILWAKYPLSYDLFIFCNEEKPGNLLAITWKNLKDGFIYDKISEIL